MYPVVFFDAMRVKIRSGMVVKPMAVHIALGIASDGSRDVLGMWIAENEGASFWASVFNNLKTRGVEDILIAVTDGLKGMTEALEVVLPRTEHQMLGAVKKETFRSGESETRTSKLRALP